jgi:hypothetical protein
VHDEQGFVVIRKPLDRVESFGDDGHLVGVAVAVGVLNEADFAFDFAVRAEAGHVIDRDEDRARLRPGGDDGRILDQRITGEQRRLEARRELQRREAFFGVWACSR